MPISGLNKDATQVQLSLLDADEEFTFYLTGSRYFGNAREDSDWDLYVQDTIQVRDFLRDNGFRISVDAAHYTNSDVHALAWWPAEISMDNEYPEQFTWQDHMKAAKIHVQLVQNDQLRLRIHEVLKRSFISLNLTDKAYAKQLWNFALGLAKAFSQD